MYTFNSRRQTALLAAVFALAVGGLIALGLFAGDRTTSASHAGGADAMSVDMDPSSAPANTGTSIGTVQTCARINENDTLDADEDSVDTLRVDVIIDTIPISNPALATNFLLNFPGGGTEFTVAQTATPFATDAGWGLLNLSDGAQTDGGYLHSVIDTASSGTAGSGALSELTMETIPGVASGLYPLNLTEMAHIDTLSVAQVPDNAIDTTLDTQPDSVVGAEVAINQSCPQPPTDVEIISLTLTSLSGPSVAAGTNFDLEAAATATNNGPNPADIEISIDLSIPADCTRIPNSNQTESFLNVPASESRTSTLTWVVNCTQPSDHALSASASVAVTGLADESAPLNNGPINQQTNVAITGAADPKITAVVVSAPAGAATGGPFTVSVEATLHNNGPITPTNVDVTFDLIVPANCTRVPNNTQASADVSLAQSTAVLEQRDWTVTCTTTGIKTFNGSASLDIDQLHVTDSNGGNNSGSGQASTDTSLGVADVKVTSVSVTSDPTANIGANFPVSVNSIVHNNGPFTPVTADIVLSINLPPDCSTAVGSTTFQNLSLQVSVAVALPQVTFFVSCSDQSFHDFSATVDVAIDDPNAGDPTPSNNSATSSAATTAVLRTSDLKVSSVAIGVAAPADTNTPFNVTVDTTVHNNGPDDAAPADVEISLALPPDCTTPSNPVTVPVTLALSAATALPAETFPVTCTDKSSHSFQATVTLLPPLHVDDQTPGNDSATSANEVTPVFDISDLKLTGVTVDWDPQPQVNAAFDVIATNDVHNNGPSGPAIADVTSTLNLPPDCSTTDANPQTTEDVALAISTSTPVDIIWSVTCTSESFHSFSADTTIALDDLHVRDPNNVDDAASSASAAIAVFASADGKIVSTIAISPPTSITANADVNITIRKELHNNGPFGTTNFDLTKSITPPAGCTVTPPPTTSHALAVSTAIIVDEVWVINCQAGSYSLSFENTLTPTELHISDPTAFNNTSVVTVNVFVDTDGDGIPDDVEVACGSNLNDGNSVPERIDGAFSGVDDDGDTQIDEALPGSAASFDCDRDGYTGTVEDHVYSPNKQGDQDQCGANSFPAQDPPTAIGWPADFRSGGIPDSTDKITILDITSFLAPIRYLGTDLGTNPGDHRWDLVPGKGIFLTDINITDLVNLIIVSPPMLGGVKAFGGPACPSP